MRTILTALLVALAMPLAGIAADKPSVTGAGASEARLEAARAFARASGMWQAMLIEVSDLGSVVVDGLRQDRPDLRPDQADDIRQLVNTRFEAEQGDLLDAVSGVLAAHLDPSDLNALTTYFEGPAGRAQAQMIARGREMTVEEMEALVMALPDDQRAEVEAFGNSEAARNWLDAQPRFMAEVEEVSNRFGENLVRGAAPGIRAILAE